MAWTAGSDADLAWPASVAERDPYGFDVGEMPDAVYVLHPIYKRTDGLSIDEQVWRLMPDPLPPNYRRVSWREYADRNRVPLFAPDRGPGLYSLDGIWDDRSVISPAEGVLVDELVWTAVFDLLIQYSPSGAETSCTAYYNPFWLFDPSTNTSGPHIFRGRLGNHRDLFDLDGIGTPQNVWPDDHAWVLLTHEDAWATQISGAPALIEAFIAAPEIETVRRNELP